MRSARILDLEEVMRLTGCEPANLLPTPFKRGRVNWSVFRARFDVAGSLSPVPEGWIVRITDGYAFGNFRTGANRTLGFFTKSQRTAVRRSMLKMLREFQDQQTQTQETSTMTTPVEVARQGDVLLHRIGDELPKGCVPETGPDAERRILAHGEKTGHAHQLFSTALEDDAMAIKFFRGSDGQRLVWIGGGGAELRHVKDGRKAEHDPISLTPGVYAAPVQVEFQRGELQRVAD